MRKIDNKSQAKRGYSYNSLYKYLAAGLTAFVLEYTSFYIMYSIVGFYLLIANSFSFVIGLTASFIINRMWAFSQKEYGRKTSHQAGFYLTLALINLLISNIVVEIFRQTGESPEIGKLLIMGVIPVWNYFIFKQIIFKHKSETGH